MSVPGADVAILDPSDVALPKWVEWAIAIGGAILHHALYSDENCEDPFCFARWTAKDSKC